MIRPTTAAAITLLALVAPTRTTPPDDTPLEAAEAACAPAASDVETSVFDLGGSAQVDIPRGSVGDVVDCLFDELDLPSWPIFLISTTNEDDGFQSVEATTPDYPFNLELRYDLWWRWGPSGGLTIILVGPVR